MAHDTRSFSEPVDYSSFGMRHVHAISPKVRDDYDRFLAEVSDTGLSGQPFLHAVMRSIYASFRPELLFLGVCRDGDDAVRTLVTYTNGERSPAFSFNIAHTPCTDVLGPQALCIYPAGAHALFPRAPRLQQMQAEGYAGMPLFSRAGTRIGILTAITTEPIEDIAEVRGVFAIFGARLSLELERTLAVPAERGEVQRAIAEEEARLASGTA